MWSRIKNMYLIFTIQSFIVIGLFAATPAFSAFFCPATGHYYDFITNDGPRGSCNTSWTTSRDQAAAAGGYLVTVTSAAEQACLQNNAVAGSWWSGGSDAAVEGVWRWVTGPEAGTQFWQGFGGGFATPPFNYANWFAGEPNSPAEDYMVWNGPPFGWNDVGITNPIVCGYIIEYDTNPDGIEISLDIKPQSCPNPINTKSKGVIPVAIMGTDDFDVLDVEIVSLQLAGVEPIHVDVEDVGTPSEPFIGKESCTEDCNELGPDGFLDLTIKFDKQEVLEALGDVEDGECLILELTGETTDGTSILGEDVIVVKDKAR